MTSLRLLHRKGFPSGVLFMWGAVAATVACGGAEPGSSGSGGGSSSVGGGRLGGSTGGITGNTGGSGSGGDAAGTGGLGALGGLGGSMGGTTGNTGGSGSGGDAAGAGGLGGAGTQACEADTPPAEFLETMEITYAEMIGEFDGQPGARPPWFGVIEYDNFIWDQVFATGGKLNYCIRWDSAGTLTTTRVAEIEETLDELANIWFQFLEGYNCWPFGHIPVRVVGVAVAARQRAAWGDDEGVPVYVGDFREGAPQCPEACGRFFHTDGDYSGCEGGDDQHYDLSLWLTDGFDVAVGSDWGQRMAPESFNLDDLAWMSIHEFGHGLGYPDYYNWEEWTNVEQPVSIMSYTPTGRETEWDAAFTRFVWDRLKDRLL